MKIDITCKKCGQTKRMNIGQPKPGVDREEHLRLLHDRLMHRPSFECFGGHMELKPAVPEFWDVHWDTVGDE